MVLVALGGCAPRSKTLGSDGATAADTATDMAKDGTTATDTAVTADAGRGGKATNRPETVTTGGTTAVSDAGAMGSDAFTGTTGVPWPNVSLLAARPADGTPVPASALPAVNAAMSALDGAQVRQDRDGIAQAVYDLRRALGDFQGVAEVAATYGAINKAALSATNVLPMFLAEVERGLLGQEPWVAINRSTRGDDQTAPLRGSCDIVTWYLALIPIAEALAPMLTANARQGLDWLISVQRPDGLFPFPDLSGIYDRYLADCLALGKTRSSGGSV